MDGRNQAPTDARPETSRRLGEILREARVAKGLELSDVAEVTHVRKEYLRALDEGRYGDLPEDVYTRNFVRLYAQTLGLNDAQLLKKFKEERHPEKSVRPVAPAPARKPPKPAPVSGPVKATPAKPQAPAVPSAAQTAPHLDEDFWTKDPSKRRGKPLLWLTGMVVVLAALGFAWWASRNQTATSAEAPPPAATSEAVAGQEPGALAEPETTASSVLLSLSSVPPGAEVTLDGFYLGTTPLSEVPIRGRPNGLIRVSLEGYDTAELAQPLTSDTDLTVNLAAPSSSPASPETTSPSAPSEGTIVLSIASSPSWLEVYGGDIFGDNPRSDGDRLFYGTAQPGQTLEFDLPVYVHAGSAGSVSLTINGQGQGTLGTGAAVVSRLFR